ncbi:MAG: AAA family ATPase, partial [Planctomycetes bacterium]|nr:AAA family ATPase [Planctomycetota bacterium]
SLNEYREQERSAQRRMNEIVEAQNNLKIRENERNLKLEALCEKAKEDLEIQDLAAKAKEISESPESMEFAFTIGNDSDPDDPDTMQAEVRESLADGEPMPIMSESQMQTLIEDITVKISRIGPVNMYAIEELTELEARGEFLKSEQEDLESAANDLLAVIERLNDECYRRFEDTFTTVRDNFQEMFRKLFGGGKADLVLEDLSEVEGGDKLNAGIDIIARPPGKEPKNISLLSGGEKALCAVALLFAIFRSKPSPFCILDEVDGPLDESNIDRFMGAVKEFTTDTQFILISHAKRTMSMTDTIYGVTQDEPGVSTKYSLRFTDMNDKVSGKEGAQEQMEVVAAG